MTLWPFQGLRPLSLHNGAPLGHYLYNKGHLQVVIRQSGLNSHELGLECTNWYHWKFSISYFVRCFLVLITDSLSGCQLSILCLLSKYSEKGFAKYNFLKEFPFPPANVFE